MQLLVKIIASAIIILLGTYVGKKVPSLAGLIVVMPITGFMVLIWLGSEKNSTQIVFEYSKGALWGIIPTIPFCLTTLFLFPEMYLLSAPLSSAL